MCTPRGACRLTRARSTSTLASSAACARSAIPGKASSAACARSATPGKLAAGEPCARTESGAAAGFIRLAGFVPCPKRLCSLRLCPSGCVPRGFGVLSSLWCA